MCEICVWNYPLLYSFETIVSFKTLFESFHKCQTLKKLKHVFQTSLITGCLKRLYRLYTCYQRVKDAKKVWGAIPKSQKLIKNIQSALFNPYCSSVLKT